MTKIRVAVLCYGVSADLRSVIGSIAEEYSDRIEFSAYPLVRGIADEQNVADLPFPCSISDYTPKYGRLPGSRTRPEEVTLLGLYLKRMWAMVGRADVICHLGIQGGPAILATALAKIRGRRVVTIHQAAVPRIEVKRSWLVRAGKRWVLRNSDRVVAQSAPTYETLRGVYAIEERRIVRSLYDAGGQIFESSLREQAGVDRARERQDLGVRNDECVIIYCGTLVGYKGLDVLLDAFQRFPHSGHAGVLLIAGRDGKPKGVLASLRQQAASLGSRDAVQFLGQVPWAELAKKYKAADVFMLPSRRDSWGKVVVEAMLAGLPVVVTEACGSSVLVKEDENGYVVPVGDPGALCAALERLNDPERRLRMGRAARRSALEYLETARAEKANVATAILAAVETTDRMRRSTGR